MLYSINWPSIVNQIYFNKNIIKLINKIKYSGFKEKKKAMLRMELPTPQTGLGSEVASLS